MHEKTVSAIVPFFNEEKTIAKVVQTLLHSELVSEVICVNDGSTDKSSEALKIFGNKIRLIECKENQGKGFAVAKGIKMARGKIVVFFDADLVNFSARHIRLLLTPVLSGKYRTVLGVNALAGEEFLPWDKYLAGERAYSRADLVPHLSKLSKSKGAGASEVYLNTLFSKKEVKLVPLPGLIKPSKQKKWPLKRALSQWAFSGAGVLTEIGRIEINSFSDFKKIENCFQIEIFGNIKNKISSLKIRK